ELGRPTGDSIISLPTLKLEPETGVTLSEARSDVRVLRAVPVGDRDAGRFVSGKAIIRRGDTLWDIAHRYYGRGIRYDTIVRANRDLIRHPARIYPGQVFTLPPYYDD